MSVSDFSLPQYHTSVASGKFHLTLGKKCKKQNHFSSIMKRDLILEITAESVSRLPVFPGLCFEKCSVTSYFLSPENVFINYPETGHYYH